MKYLLNVTENYRVESEAEVEKLIQEAKDSGEFILSKYTSQFKEQKQKGEVVDSWFKVSLTKEFTKEKEPDGCTTIEYNTNASAF